MPRYDLRCPDCGHTWEVSRSLTADNPPCPTCGSVPEQVPTRMAFALKGGGWAATGYQKGRK